MRVNREKIGKVLDLQGKLDMNQRGAQPALALGCFYSLGTDRTETICEQCRHYEGTCERYLAGFEINENPFEIHRQEVYARMMNGRK